MASRLPICLLLIAGLANVNAKPANPVSLADLTSRAQAIVAGTLLDGQQSGQTVSFRLMVNRSVTGTLSPGQIVTVDWQSPEVVPGITALPKVQGIWFLTAVTGVSSLLPLDLNGGFSDTFLPLTSTSLAPAYQYESPSIAAAAAPLERVILEIGSALESADRYSMGRFLRLLDTVPAASASGALNRLASSSTPTVQVASLSRLVRSGDTTAIQRVLNNYDTLGSAPNITQLKESIALYFRNPQPAAVAVLAKLAQRDGELKLPAIQALRDIHTRETLPILAGFLDASGPGIQALAVAGISAYVMNLPIYTQDSLPSMSFMRPIGPSPLRTPHVEAYLCIDNRLPPGRTNELVNFWRNWWAQNRASLTA
jgi:hypothetical protein